MLNVKTPEQVKSEFEARGESFADWAREHGYDRLYVYRVLNGTIKASYGKSHEIAVKLSLKAAA